MFNPFHVTGLFRYPLKTSKNEKFSCFQGVPEETSGMKWVNMKQIHDFKFPRH